QTRSVRGVQRRTDEVCVRLTSAVGCGCGFEGIAQSQNVTGDCRNRASAKSWLDLVGASHHDSRSSSHRRSNPARISRPGKRAGHTGRTNLRSVGKLALRSSRPAVWKHVAPERTVEVQTSAPTDNRLSIAAWIPGEAKLRSDVLTRVLNCVAETCTPSIERGQWTQVVIQSSRIVQIPHTVSKGQISLVLPCIPRIGFDPII